LILPLALQWLQHADTNSFVVVDVWKTVHMLGDTRTLWSAKTRPTYTINPLAATPRGVIAPQTSLPETPTLLDNMPTELSDRTCML
jgi:hypothetical protein